MKVEKRFESFILILQATLFSIANIFLFAVLLVLFLVNVVVSFSNPPATPAPPQIDAIYRELAVEFFYDEIEDHEKLNTRRMMRTFIGSFLLFTLCCSPSWFVSEESEYHGVSLYLANARSLLNPMLCIALNSEFRRLKCS